VDVDGKEGKARGGGIKRKEGSLKEFKGN